MNHNQHTTPQTLPHHSARQAVLEQYTIATPYGTLTITNHGRSITFNIYDDIRQSEHNIALYNYVQQLKRTGVTKFNNDHIAIPGANPGYNLTRGKARLDLVYYHQGKIHEVELKTTQQIGTERTHMQLVELAKHSSNLILAVRRQDTEEARTILNIINLDHQVKVDSYEIYEEDDND